MESACSLFLLRLSFTGRYNIVFANIIETEILSDKYGVWNLLLLMSIYYFQIEYLKLYTLFTDLNIYKYFIVCAFLGVLQGFVVFDRL